MPVNEILINILFIAIGVWAGIYIGAIPGLSVTMAASLLITMTYSWSTNLALSLMIGVYVGGVYGGSRAAILLNIPGAPAAVATTFDGYPLAKRGLAGKAIAVSTIMSVIGGMIGLIIMVIAAPQISKMAVSFGPRDYFILVLMGLMMVGGLGGKSVVKGLFMATVGLMLGVVGTDEITGLGRFTFGVTSMRNGVSYISVMIGMFGISEALIQLRSRNKPIVRQELDKISPPGKKLLKMLPLCLQSSIIGTFVGALPGAGGDIAALLAYNTAKNTVKNSDVPLGEGAYEGVVAPESANNAAIGGALIPMLTLGIPGDSVTAIMIGALSIHGIRCSPMIMTTQPDLFNKIALMLLAANIFLLIFGMTGIRVFAKLTEVPRDILVPIIVVVGILGSYSINNNSIDILWTVIFGIIGYIFKRYDYPCGPMVLGLILGPMIEMNFRRAVISAGSLGSMLLEIVTSPISLILLAVLALLLVSQFVKTKKE